MKVKNFEELVKKTNEAIGSDFAKKLQYKRKELTGNARASGINELFGNVHPEEQWAINVGGNIEIQFHISLYEDHIEYGLGFNIRYVQFKNDMLPSDYIRPYTLAYLDLESELDLYSKGYKILHGNKELLKNPKEDNYISIGKTIPVAFSNNYYQIDDEAFAQMINNIKELYPSYVKIFERSNYYKAKNIKIIKTIKSVMESKNLILTGAPGTGKTYLANEIAQEITSNNTEDKKEYVVFVQFNPSYDYTDFVEGLRPIKKHESNSLGFELKNGIFKELCITAKNDSNNNYVIIIDEINRAEISRVFGELFFAIEPSYRGEKGRVKTQYANMQTGKTVFEEGGYFYVPENVFIIGTMNDIDRSVEAFDFAMRRRFTWKEVTATERSNMLYEELDKEIATKAEIRMQNLNMKIEKADGLNRSYHIGPAYFLNLKEHTGDFEKLWEYNLKPLILEYLRGLANANELEKQFYAAYSNETKVTPEG
jgi:5-methylcytosine-specific restriction endonuclease McrBC GTP-binding regulatory subunit McrB